MTDLETQLYEALWHVRQYHNQGERALKGDYTDMMKDVRNGLQSYENIRSGCSTGRHAGPTTYCTCPKTREIK